MSKGASGVYLFFLSSNSTFFSSSFNIGTMGTNISSILSRLIKSNPGDELVCPWSLGYVKAVWRKDETVWAQLRNWRKCRKALSMAGFLLGVAHFESVRSIEKAETNLSSMTVTFWRIQVILRDTGKATEWPGEGFSPRPADISVLLQL